MKDYYEILGVAPDATPESIRNAYRRLAKVYHPDRGGSHEKMVLLNEAWGILSDPESRRRYDLARRRPEDATAQTAAAADVTRAKKQAEKYSRVWDDFVKARYGESEGWPTAGDSVTGWLSIFAGGALGCGVTYLLIWVFVYFLGRQSSIARGWQQDQIEHGWSILPDFLSSTRPPFFAFGYFLALGAMTGAWLGQKLHRVLRWSIIGARHETRAEGKVIIGCPACGKRLRVPVGKGQLTVSCPACSHKFSHDS